MVVPPNIYLPREHNSADRLDAEPQRRRVGATLSDEGHRLIDPHFRGADIGYLLELYRDYRAMVRTHTALTLQVKSFCRRIVGGDKGEADKLLKSIEGEAEHPLTSGAAARLVPFFAARDEIEKSRKQRLKEIEKLAKSLPAFGFVATAPGFGTASFAAVIAECGDLSNYANPAKVWKRMGLAVVDGKAQRRVTGIDGITMGFSPARRSLMWNIGECIVKSGKGKYRAAYDARKAYEVERNPEIKKIAAHARAKRYAEKLLLKDLWRYWRDVSRETNETNR